jgi:formamidopyrimidine-DNA glycosylase
VPELPEVETVRRSLAPVVEGAALAEVEILDARLTRPVDPHLVAAELGGERVVELARRGKYLLWRFESGRTLVVHLRMTGSFRCAAQGALPDDLHRRACLRLDTGVEVGYRDVRRFGTWLLLEPEEEVQYLDARLGPEPLDPRFTTTSLGDILRHRRAPVKAVLLDQRRVAGIGNIYADEALWRARIHPRRPASSLDRDEVRRLHRAARHVLRRGIELQGSSLRDYAAPDGSAGAMQDEFAAYGRGGEPCLRCGTPIERLVVAGRGTWVCASCAKPESAGADPGRLIPRVPLARDARADP